MRLQNLVNNKKHNLFNFWLCFSYFILSAAPELQGETNSFQGEATMALEWRDNAPIAVNDGSIIRFQNSLEIVAPSAETSSLQNFNLNCADIAIVNSSPVKLSSSVVSSSIDDGSLSVFAPSVEVPVTATSLQGPSFATLINDGSYNQASGNLSFDTTGLYVVATGAFDPDQNPLSGNFLISSQISQANVPLGKLNMGPAITHTLSNIGTYSDSGSHGFEQRNSISCADFSRNPGVGFAITDSSDSIQWNAISITIE